jgi:predicted dienelactone hydrolase
VVVFSQGAATPDACCDSLLRHWASYGYVTLEPRPNEGAAGKPVSYDLQGRLFDSARYIMQNPTLWDSRPKDISFLLNSLQEISELLPSFRDKMDAARTGMSGHLLGAYITEVIAGARVDLPGQPGTDASSQASFADRRIRAALALSPLGPGQLGLTESSWDAVAIPYMGVIGSIDTVGHSASPCWCRAPFELSQPGDKYQVVIRGADELSLVARRSPTARYVAKPQSALDDVECATLAFWDAYLKGDPAAKRYLGSDALAKYSNGTVSIERR